MHVVLWNSVSWLPVPQQARIRRRGQLLIQFICISQVFFLHLGSLGAKLDDSSISFVILICMLFFLLFFLGFHGTRILGKLDGITEC